MGTSPAAPIGSNQFVDAVEDSVDGAPVAVTDSQRLVDQLRYEHPDYIVRRPKWDKYFSCYAADDIYKFIHKHPRESDDMFALRLQRGYFYNYTSSIVDLYVSYLFHSPIERREGTEKELLSEMYEDSDNAGTKYLSFMQDVATNAQVFGWCGVLVDAPAYDKAAVESEQDRENAGIRPYLAIIEPIQIKDWELDRDGNFAWVKDNLDKIIWAMIFIPGLLAIFGAWRAGRQAKVL